MNENIKYDIDPLETNEWLQSTNSLISKEGYKRFNFLINKIVNHIYKINFDINKIVKFNYVNSINYIDEPKYPGDLYIENNICSAIRWNAMIIVLKASNKKLDLGGHISSFQSIAMFYEVCFNHFFKASNKIDEGDIVFFQGHTSPGIYSRAFLEGRLNKNYLDNFRQEIFNKGLCSYPHPKLMPNFWEFPTVSMGLGAINAIYQAKFLKYLKNRSLKDTKNQKVYVFLGDGEMDEPESKGAITIAVREKLNNLIFIINCNLQRLDGPVNGNGKIINELEGIFLGVGWKVLKLIWGSNWDKLFKKDNSGKLIKLLNETNDGDYQNFLTKDGAYIRKNFFGKYKETYKLVENLSDIEILKLNRGGHDFIKIFAVLKKANQSNKPTVILVHTVKGYGMGKNFESQNIAHQVKKMNIKELYYFKENLNLNISDKKIKNLEYISFKENSVEYKYIQKHRKLLNGFIPCRNIYIKNKFNIPKIKSFEFLFKKQNKKISTTTVFIKILKLLLKNISIKKYLVPIISDEARTFGMEDLFQQIGIYNSNGQKYIPQDINQFSYYKEDKAGQILQEGINESGAISSWLAAATSYSVNNLQMIPFYIFYSIFGFQRIGDLLWAAGDQQAKGFLIGATSGRTTLNGEGLQHEDGHSHIYSLTIPNCISYDPTYAYELSIIIQNGIKRMYGKNKENIYYYITVTNENYNMPKILNNIKNGILKGIYKLESLKGGKNKIQLLGSGAILRNVRKASYILLSEYNISSDIFSVTSFTELTRDGQDCERWNMLHPNKTPKIPYVNKILNNFPTIASSDYIKLFSEQIAKFLPNNYYSVLGTDGFGRSDSRMNLRYYFEIDSFYILIASLNLLYKNNKINKSILYDAFLKFNININKNNPRIL
ncbi:MAG: pyruvate dehydrogenase (acetyl-transferring), homodimeric type [Enterobacteriaceae bacterium PSmelAO3-2]|nr:pyruvate dehydrogenase (acetyl-transferring), homodimeric type [Enterobacteriaceae bacterium Cmel17]WMC17493.1 MAG: pyruvate dehydrogenase (acetyl-transferring), homodimeric type [Enterobacteriaceae bacterium Cmel21]WMC17700.1 MAG: pyruvate dehydrogenase (acetyl-transferring), homodimeric type [Enterobacteriaceae bacterium PSmelAO3-2]WMC17904.1 MAG: pyruvate dehydrogenase (acetyl-transferring), homodimeric type [Enterobacteriaceae bacterium PSmelAO3-1]WMC18107.1 MAG: pyruvate dehydrogenase (